MKLRNFFIAPVFVAARQRILRKFRQGIPLLDLRRLTIELQVLLRDFEWKPL